MTSILTERWLWILIITLILIMCTPFLILWFIVSLPPPFSMIATLCLIIGWGIVAGYKDWIMSKSKKEKQRYES